MQVRHLSLKITVLFSLVLISVSQAQVVSIPDPNLAAAIREQIGNSITKDTLLNLTHLEVRNRGIEDLTGLEHAYNLRQLDLGGAYIEAEERVVNSNTVSDFSPLLGLTQLKTLWLAQMRISDITPLAGLTQLTNLHLGGNAIADISTLSGLTQLAHLHLGGNVIADITPLTRMTQLTNLTLWNNAIADITPLAEIIQLTHLHLGDNAISDISALSRMTRLTNLNLWGNAVSDITPLTRMTQLTRLDLRYNTVEDISPIVALNLPGTDWDSTGLYLNGNPLSYAAIHTHIPAMQAKGIEVQFDARTPTTLIKILGTAQQGTINTTLPLPFIVEVRDQRGLVFSGVPVTFTITTGRGRLNTTTTTTEAAGRAAAHLTLGGNIGTTTVRVAAADLSQTVKFTATATEPSSPVAIPDANLHAEISNTLGKLAGEILTTTDMLKLTVLTANHADLLDLTGLQYAVNLTRLSLGNNNISNVAPLTALKKLTTLDLRNNRISDIATLIDLKQSESSKDWHELHLQGNPLSDTTIDKQIPRLQAMGVNVHFDSGVARPVYKVRLIYFLPRDRQPQPDINTKMDQLVRDVQTFYAKQMEVHGFGRKTFQFETDANGNAVVYHINGKYPDVYYHDETSSKTDQEIYEQFDESKNFYFIAVDVSSQWLGSGAGGACGVGGGGNHSGGVILPASGGCFGFTTAAHELGHAFGLDHDFRDDSYIMFYGPGQNQISECTAKQLDIHRAFNPNGKVSSNTPNKRAVIEMLSPNLAAPPNAIRFRFEVTDPEGLHQAQLYTQTLRGPAKGFAELVSCKEFNNTSNGTVEFVTTVLGPTNTTIFLEVIDRHGDITTEEFAVDISNLLPAPRSVSIPDPNLAAAIREEIGNAITTQTLLNLRDLEVPNRGIANLTGLEHAHNLIFLNLSGAYIEAENRVVNSNTVSDFSPLSGLTQLKTLRLTQMRISDTSTLSGLTQLRELNLNNTSISDISALSGLTQLTTLSLWNNSISDITPLAEITQLINLELGGNAISDVTPLAELTQLTRLDLRYNSVEDISPLVALNLTGTDRDNTGLFLNGNPLSYTAIHTHIPAMQAKGIKVSFDLDIYKRPPDDIGRVDVNSDGVVNVLDLVFIASRFGETGENSADVNGDGVVNIIDLVKVAGELGTEAAAPSAHPQILENLTVTAVQQWLRHAQHYAPSHRGTLILKQLLAALIPKTTSLLANYPNPFNPETWIPYQLTESADVTLHIYSVKGALVRRLALGHQPAGRYHSRNRAAYWDGRNAHGETVASGIYFYTLSASDFTATRKLLIQK